MIKVLSMHIAAATCPFQDGHIIFFIPDLVAVLLCLLIGHPILTTTSPRCKRVTLLSSVSPYTRGRAKSLRSVLCCNQPGQFPLSHDAALNISFGQGLLAQIFFKSFIVLSLQINTPVKPFLNLSYPIVTRSQE